MTTATQTYVGYEIRVPAGIPHRGITHNPEQTLAEHRERLGPDAFMQILTPPLSLREARQWEQFRKQRRHYRPDPANPWGSPRRPDCGKTPSDDTIRTQDFQGL